MKFKRRLSNIIFMSRYFVTFGKQYIIFIILGALFQSLKLYTEVKLMAVVVNSLINQSFDLAFNSIIFYCLILMVCAIYSNFTYYYYPLLASKVSKKMSIELMQKSLKIDYFCFDNNEYYDAYTRASSEAANRLQHLIGTYIGLVHSMFSIVTIITLLFQISIFYFFPVLISVIASLIAMNKRNKIKYNFEMQNTEKFRKLSYIKNLFFNISAVKEFKIYDCAHFFIKKYEKEHDEYYSELKKYNFKHESPVFIETCINYLCLFVNMLIALYQVFKKIIIPGTFVSSVLAANRLKEQLLSFFSLFPNLLQHATYIENIRVVFEYSSFIENDLAGCEVDISKGINIEFRNVYFKYPDTDKYILNDFNMKISHLSKCALVGENGAGKTTIVKLLLRLYDVSEGEILVNGINIKEINIKSLRKIYSVAFQDYMQYNISLKENICLSNTINNDKIISVISEVDLSKKIIEFNLDLNSMLGRNFDKKGIVLSGGEAQKLALARAFFKEANILILDEPSSSLDPIAEQKLISTISNEAKNKSMMVISHRLSLCKDMDIIYYLENGKSIETGTHKELMELNGKYATMFNIQAQKYI